MNVRWDNAGPYGGAVNALVADPSTPGRLLVAASAGACFESLDNGRTWSFRNDGIRWANMQALALGPGGVAYIGGYRGVFRSAGPNAPWVAAGLDTEVVNCLAVHPLDARTAYAVTVMGGLQKTTDNGATWAQVGAQALAGLYTMSIAIDPMAPDRVFAGHIHGLFRSPDGGARWADVSGLLAGRNVNQVLRRGTSLFAAATGGVFESQDDGFTWQDVSHGLPQWNIAVKALALSPTGDLFAGIYRDGVFLLTSSWTWAQFGTNAMSSLTSLAWSGGDLLAGTGGDGVFRFRPMRWDPSNQGLAATIIKDIAAGNLVVYAGTNVGTKVHASDNGGRTWNGRDSGIASTVNSIAMDPMFQDAAFAGATGQGVMKTTDAGVTWTPTALKTGNVEAVLAIRTGFSMQVHAAVYGGDYQVSDDDGATWETSGWGLGLSSSHVRSLSVDPSAPLTIYATTFGDGVFRSSDGGKTYSDISAGLSGQFARYVERVAVDATTTGVLWAATWEGLFRKDGGQDWRVWAAPGLPQGDASAVLCLLGDRVLVGTYSDGVFVSLDGGRTFAPATRTPARRVTRLVADPLDPAGFYAGCAGGVWHGRI